MKANRGKNIKSQDVISRLVESTRMQYSERDDSDELVSQLLRIPQLVEQVITECMDITNDKDEKWNSTFHSLMYIGKAGIFKLDGAYFLDNFIGGQICFVKHLPAKRYFRDPLSSLANSRGNPKDAIRKIALLVLKEHSLLMRRNGTIQEALYFLFWLSRAVALMLFHIIQLDLKAIKHEPE